MRTHFGPEDEDAFYAARDDLLEAYRTISEGRDDAPDGFVASIMLEYKWGYGDGRIADWHRHDVEDVLLGHFPRKVTLDDEDLLRVAPDMADFLAFLDHRGLLTGDPLTSLREAATGLVPEFVDAMQDPDRFGMAKGLFAHMRAEGVDIEDPSAIGHWIEDFNARSLEDRDALLEPLPERSILPAIELPPVDELERAALASSTLGRLTAFARYVGKGRKLTQQGYLTLADGRALVESLGTGDRLDQRIGDRVFTTRSTAELPRLDLTFRWARAAGFVKVQHGRVSATRRGTALGSKPLEDWHAALQGLLKVEAVGPRPRRRYGPFWDVEMAWFVERLPQWLYERPDLELDRLKEVVWKAIEAIYYLSPETEIRESQRRLIGHDVDYLLERFVELGAVTVADGRATLTPLGLWATNRSLRAQGDVAPVVGEQVAASASALLEACAEMPLGLAEREIRSWIETRPETAVTELAEAARSGALPMLALHALSLAGPGAEAEFRALLDDADLRPQAQLWLVGHGYDDPSSLSPEAMQAAFVETLAAQVDADGAVAAVAHFQGLGPESEQLTFIEGLLRVEHPRTAEILGIVGRYHPSKVVAKAARKVAFKRQAIHPS
ncbi:hypothetical protein BH24CHL9_BH24CHL9_00720 [soil metagenome]